MFYSSSMNENNVMESISIDAEGEDIKWIVKILKDIYNIIKVSDKGTNIIHSWNYHQTL